MLTKEEIKKIKDDLGKIEFPLGIEQSITKKITERFDKAGLFYHCRYRFKATNSIIHKYTFKEIKDEHKIQDMIGIKFVFCFVDDLKIAEKIINNLFGGTVKHWSKTEESIDGFAATKINGVFKIPHELLSDETRKKLYACKIDDTFEVQLKTMLFDGWHETDHDLRYKSKDLWNIFPEMNRKLNRVLATLELCDDSVISVFDKLTYRTYKEIKENAATGTDYKVNPLILERVAQSRLRIKVKELFSGYPTNPDDKKDIPAEEIEEYNKAENIKQMRDHFSYNIERMFLEKCTDEAKAKADAKAFTDKIMDIFLDVRFLKFIVKYDRSKLIDNLLGYRNNFDIDIYSICALICSDPKSKNLARNKSESELSSSGELLIDEETISNLKRYLRRRYIGRRESKPIPVKRCREYPTYQCYTDIFPADAGISIENLFCRVFKRIASWMNGKLGIDKNSSDNRKMLEEYATSDVFDINEDVELFETAGYDFRILYLKDHKTAAFRLIEPDNQYEAVPNNVTRSVANNRTFTTDISICMVDDEAGGHVELAVRTSCKEAEQSLELASAFRTGFIKKLYNDKEHFIICEHGIPQSFKWLGDGETIYKTKGIVGDYKELLDSTERQTPVVIIPRKAYDDPDLGVASLTASLCGYGHVIVDESSEADEIKIYYPKKLSDEDTVKFDTIDPEPIEANDNSLSGLKTYGYAWRDIYTKVTGFLVGKNRFGFGDVMLYRDLKNAYYEAKEESVENLKKQINNLKRELNELKGK